MITLQQRPNCGLNLILAMNYLATDHGPPWSIFFFQWKCFFGRESSQTLHKVSDTPSAAPAIYRWLYPPRKSRGWRLTFDPCSPDRPPLPPCWHKLHLAHIRHVSVRPLLEAAVPGLQAGRSSKPSSTHTLQAITFPILVTWSFDAFAGEREEGKGEGKGGDLVNQNGVQDPLLVG